MKRSATNTLMAALLVAALLCFPIPSAQSQDAGPLLAPPLRGPDDLQPVPLNLPSVSSLEGDGSGLRAVAIVGEVGSHTGTFRDDMDRAVDVLRDHGVAVETFYYGERAFDWRDIVPALTGANFLLYMGHGVYWSGPCAEPTLVGGFYLGDDGDGDQADISFVRPSQIRSDLAGRMADNAVVILSHACFSAGDTACDGGHDEFPNWPTQAEAERRVRMYAAPFVDVGLKAYLANNYYYSAAGFVEHLLADNPPSVGQIFKSVYPYTPSQFRNLDYPDDPAYDLWLSGTTGNWSDAFVGVPDYVFGADATPQLGPLPDTVSFTHYLSDTVLIPSSYTVTPTNVGSDDPLSWEVVGSGDWFTVTPTSGETSAASASPSDGFTIVPHDAEGVAAESTSGTVTVTVTNPEGTIDGVQTIDVTLRSVAGAPNLVYLPLIMSR